MLSGADVSLAYGLWDPEPTAEVGQAHSDLQAYSVAHRDIEGLGAVVMALQGHSQDSPRVAHQRKRVSPSLKEHYLLLVQGVVLQTIHLQELLGHPDAGQICKDTKVAGHPKACEGAKGVSWVVGMG